MNKIKLLALIIIDFHENITFKHIQLKDFAIKNSNYSNVKYISICLFKNEILSNI